MGHDVRVAARTPCGGARHAARRNAQPEPPSLDRSHTGAIPSALHCLPTAAPLVQPPRSGSLRAPPGPPAVRRPWAGHIPRALRPAGAGRRAKTLRRICRHAGKASSARAGLETRRRLKGAGRGPRPSVRSPCRPMRGVELGAGAEHCCQAKGAAVGTCGLARSRCRCDGQEHRWPIRSRMDFVSSRALRYSTRA
jgi:hypothetical protein